MNYSNLKTKGMALILMVMLLVVASLFSLVSVNLFVSGISLSQGSLDKTRAYALALAGKNWYFEHLQNDSDWSDETNLYGITLDNGQFDVIVNQQTPDTINFTVVARIGNNQPTVQELSLTAIRAPKASFALFWQESGPQSSLNFSTSSGGTNILGNIWSVGSAVINSPSSVSSGMVYYGQGETISGSGVYQTEMVVEPFPDMPAIDTSSYDALKSDWNNRISLAAQNPGGGNGNGNGKGKGKGGGGGQPSSADCQLNNDVTLSGTTNCDDFRSNGYNIQGNDYVINCDNFLSR